MPPKKVSSVKKSPVKKLSSKKSSKKVIPGIVPRSESDVTSVWLKDKLTELEVHPIPSLKADRWKEYLKAIRTKPIRKTASKGGLTKSQLMEMTIPKLKNMAKSLEIEVKGLKKPDLVTIIHKQQSSVVQKELTKRVSKARVKRVNPRKIIKGSVVSPPPRFLELGCRSLVGNQKLMAHQEKVIDHFNKHSGLIVFHKPGSGKTLTSVSAAICWLKSNPNGLVFVAVPGHLSENFIENGLKKFYGLSHNYIAKHFVVDTYVKLPKYVSKMGLDKRPFFLIVDEGHKLKTVIKTIKRGKNVGKQKGGAPKGILELAIKAEKVLVMTGTVFRNTEKDLENLVAIARAPKEKGAIKDIIKSTSSKDPETKNVVFDPIKIKEYFKCLISYYPGDPENKSDYPEVKYHTVKIPMPLPYWKKYWREHQELKGIFLGSSDRSKEMYITNMRMAANKFLQDSPRAEEIAKIIKKDPSKKTIIYSGFKGAGVETIRDVLLKYGIKSTWLNQSLSIAKKAQIVNTYNSVKKNTDGEGIVLITKATSEGTDFKGTRRIIIMEKDFSTAAIQQIVHRGARYMSHSGLPEGEKKVDVYFLELVMPKGIPKPGIDANSGVEFKLIDERVNELIAIKDRKEANFMSMIIDPKRKVTIESDPECK